MSGIVCNFALDHLFSFFANNIEESALPQSGDDYFIWLKAMHSLEGVNVFDWDWQVGGPISLLPQVGVDG